jgi:PAS domain S-box-containing protein
MEKPAMAADDPAVRPVTDSISDDGLQTIFLQAIISSAMDAIVALDAEQRIVLFNPAAEAMFRCPATEALGQPLDRFLPQHLRTVHRRHIDAFGTTGDTGRAMGHLRPLTAIRGDGEEFPIEATIARVAVDGRPYYAAIVRDITARQHAESSLQRQADLLDLAYDAIFTWDWDGPITFWNRGAERLYGYSRDEAIGQSSHDLLHTRHPEGLNAVRLTLERGNVWEGELIHIRRDGSEVAVESRHVLVDERGHRYVLEVNRDITARKRAEAERVLSLERETVTRAEAASVAVARDALQEILDDLPGGVLLMAAPGARIEFANAAMVEMISGVELGSSRTTPAYGRDFRFLRADGTPLPADERPAMRVRRGERVQNLQLMLQRADGNALPVAVHAAPLQNAPGNPTGVIVFVQDVTQLRQAEQLKDDFLALVSHELRTPLAAIHGGSRVLVNKSDLDAATRDELLHDVVAESERLEQLLSNLLSLTDITAGRLRASLEPVLLEPLIMRVCAEVDARSQIHTFVVDIVPEVPPAEADPDLLAEVLRNLYENAVKYSALGGTIQTTVRAEGEAIVLQVTDEGVGIAPEHVAAVFERFRRVGSDSTARGMGLGLYLCRGLVDAQGGRIEASSPGLGRGATFTVTLPVAKGWAESAHP